MPQTPTGSPGTLILDPRQRCQLAPHGSFVLWRRRGGLDQGLLGTTTSALDPENNTVRVSCALINSRVVAVSVADARVLFPGGAGANAPLMEAPQGDVTIDLATGRVPPSFEAPGEIGPWLSERLNGELLEHLHHEAAQGAGLDPDRPRRRPHGPGEYHTDRFPYEGLFPHARPDTYILGDRIYVTRERHEGVLLATTPRIRITFLEAEDAVGHVVLDLTDLRLVRTPESAAALVPDQQGSLLSQLWSLYCRRHNVRPRLVARRGRLIAAVATNLLDSADLDSRMTASS